MSLDATLADSRLMRTLIEMAARWNASPDELRAILERR